VDRGAHCKVLALSAVSCAKRLNLSICHFDCGLEWAKGCRSSIVFARWRRCALVEGHVAVTCQITVNHLSAAAMCLMANYFDHLLSLDTPTYTVAQIAKRFEPSIVGIPRSTVIYTLNHEKRDILFLTITLANLNRFLYHFNREEILYATVVKFTTSP